MGVQSGRGPEARAATVGAVRGPTWVEVDLDNLAHNLGEVRKLVGPRVTVMAVVKANAYGHGAVAVSRTALRAGAGWLGVTTVEEGSELRRGGIRAPILVMGAILPEEAASVVRQNLTPTVGSMAVARELDELSHRLKRRTRIHVKIDTGLGRLGVRFEEAPEFVAHLRDLEWLEVEGVYSHFANAFQADLNYARRQLAAFREAVARIEADGVKVPLKHMANSEALVALPESRLDMVRVGNLMYGECPVGDPAVKLDLRPTWAWKARVVHTKAVKRGESIGYGRDYIARREMVVAVLPVGLAEGFRVGPIKHPANLRDLGRSLAREVLQYLGSSRFGTEVTIRDREAPVVGRVGMQTSTVDVTRIPGAEAGDVAILSAKRVIVPERIPRLYVGALAAAIKGRVAESGPRVQAQAPGQGRGQAQGPAKGPAQGQPQAQEGPHGRRRRRGGRGGERRASESAVGERVELAEPMAEGRWQEQRAKQEKKRIEERPWRPAVPLGPGEGRWEAARGSEAHDVGTPEEASVNWENIGAGVPATPAAEAAEPGEATEAWPAREPAGFEPEPAEAGPTPPPVILSGEKLSRFHGTKEGAEPSGEEPAAQAKRPFGARKKKSLRGPKRRRHTPGKLA